VDRNRSIPRGDVRVIITGPPGFEQWAVFAVNEDPDEITRRVRESIDDEL
jgi:hypothetical protein